MDRRSFLALCGLGPLSVAGKLNRPRGFYGQGPPDPPSATPISTGQSNLDEILGGGLMPGEVTLMAMIPSLPTFGALGFSAIGHHLRQRREPVAFAALGWNREAVVERLACARSGMPLHPGIRTHWGRGVDLRRHEAVTQQIESSGLHFETLHPRFATADVEQSLRRVHERHPFALVVIDDVVDLWELHWRRDASADAAASTGRQLKAIARSMRVPILAGCPVREWRDSPPVPGTPMVGCQLPSQRDLGELAPILDHCDALLLEQVLPQFERGQFRFAIEIGFHPRVRRGCVSLHTMDLWACRVSEGA